MKVVNYAVTCKETDKLGSRSEAATALNALINIIDDVQVLHYIDISKEGATFTGVVIYDDD